MNWLQKAAAAFFRIDGTPMSIGNYVPSLRISDSGESVTEYTALGLSAVWGCVNLTAGIVGSLPMTVYRKKDDVRVADPAHPLYRVLHSSPNFDQTAQEFWEFMQASLELWGNAYAEKIMAGTRVTALIPIMPDAMIVRRTTSGAIEYRWSADGKSHRKSDAEVFHVRGFGGSPLGGMSTLAFANNALGLARAVERSAGATFRNELRPSGALLFKEFLSAENRQIANEELAGKVGAGNTGKPIVLEGGAEFKPFSINPEDAQLLETRRFSVEEICRFFGVPPHMIGHTENSTSWGTGIEQQTLAFQKYTLTRRLRRIEQAINKQLLTDADRAGGVTAEFSLEGLLRGDSQGRAAFYQTMTQIGAMTINEVRRLENLSPVRGGDVPRMQMQNVPITEAENA